jgi:ABC-type Na+ efflux pump permease subunit
MVFLTPNLLTPHTRQALEFVARRYFGSLPDHRLALAAAFVAFHGPFVLALLASFTAAHIPLTVIGSEMNRGTMELLLAAPTSLRTLVLAMLAASLSFAVVSWAVLSSVTLGTSFLIIWATGVGQLLSGQTYWVIAILLPLSLTILSGLLSVFVLLRFPSLARFRPGLLINQNPAVLAAVAPALLSLLVLTFRPEVPPEQLASFVLGGSLILSGLLILVAPLLVRRETLLHEE